MLQQKNEVQIRILLNNSHYHSTNQSAIMGDVSQPGLEWDINAYDATPCWTTEPCLDTIKIIVPRILNVSQPCQVEHFSSGALSRVYLIKNGEDEFILRVSLPVDPSYKTLSEVSTLDFLLHHTSIRVPLIYAFDNSNENELGFEWIMMQRMPGATLSNKWANLSLGAKEKITTTVAGFCAQLFRRRFQNIGNIYASPLSPGKLFQSSSKTTYKIGRIVSVPFFIGDNIREDVPRGPFTSSLDWLLATLALHQKSNDRVLQHSDDEDDIEDAQHFSKIIERLFSVLPQVFTADQAECTVLFHDDLSQENILVDDNGNVTAILDWECVSSLPLWKVCQLPRFLRGKDRDEMPVKENYTLDEIGESELYSIHLLNYELTHLRKVFLEKMEKIEPAWLEVYSCEHNREKLDVDLAVQHCNDPFSIKILNCWLDSFMQGKNEKTRLYDQLM